MGRPRLADRVDRMGRPHEPSPRSLLGPADFVTALRLPLAAAFPLVDDWRWRIVIVAAAGLSDVVDGILARRLGSSRLGVLLDPIADKAFMISAFVTLAGTQVREALALWEVALVLLRDLAATAAFLATAALGRRVTVPARPAGKIVTFGQFVLLVLLVVDVEALAPALRPLAWAIGAAGVWAVVDYYRAGTAEQRRRFGGNSGRPSASEEGNGPS